MPSVTVLMRKRDRLVRQVKDNLDFLIGSVCRRRASSARPFNLTTKVDGKTVTRHIPIGMLPAVRRMTGRHQKPQGPAQGTRRDELAAREEGVELKDYGTL